VIHVASYGIQAMHPTMHAHTHTTNHYFTEEVGYNIHKCHPKKSFLITVFTFFMLVEEHEAMENLNNVFSMQYFFNESI